MRYTLTPAYGRGYNSRLEVARDFAANKDFIVETFGMPRKPINRDQLAAEGEKSVNIRYAGLRKVVELPVGI